jgi:hypothetical protein
VKEYQHFYVEKSAQAFEETLLMFGLAAVAKDLLDRQGNQGGIGIEDQGSYYELLLSKPLLAETILQEASSLMPAKALATEKTKLPEGILADRYETMKASVSAYFDSPKEMRDLMKVPPKTWDIYRAINPASLPGYNGLMVNWYRVRHQPEALFLLFNLYATLPNDYEAVMEAWKALDKREGWKIGPEAGRQQLYNPDSGKGQNKSKADGLSIRNMDNFWLSEWLKAIGFYEAALTKLLKATKDRKSIVLAPRKLSFEQHQKIMAEFRHAMSPSESAIRFDLFAAIRYSRSLIEYLSEGVEDPAMTFSGSLADGQQGLVAGFHTAFYKDMGHAVATMNRAFMALPVWINGSSRDELQVCQAMLDELEEIVRQLDESHSDELSLLQCLRDFVSGNSLSAFFEFTNAFPPILMRKRESIQFVRLLSTRFIERIVMSSEKELSPILASPGFQNIAYAIRQATITAQYRRKQRDNKYEIRYGLGQELARKARYPQEFIAALSYFLHHYNAENARVMQLRPAPYRRSVQTSDIDEIVHLIDNYGSETVANLLIAYGYARLTRDEDFQKALKGEEE